MRRSARSGVLERLLSFAFVYPFRCQRCAHRFHTLHWRRYPHAKSERRDFERVVIRLSARLTAGGQSFDAETMDLSVGGSAMRTEAGLPAGTTVRVNLRLAAGKSVDIAEAVVRAAAEGRVSLQFVHIAVADQRRLTEFMHGMALPSGGERRRAPGLPAVLLGVALAGLVVILLVLTLLRRVGAPAR